MRNSGSRDLSRRTRIEHLESRRLLALTPVITEFMASNSASLLDGDGHASDWVEIYNPTSSALDLAGWKLTDNASNLAKWTFPSTIVNPGQYLVVFASSQLTPNYIDPLGYRHTTFALSAGGEYLGLVNPSGTVVSEFAPQFPAQSADISYGLDGAGLGAYFSHPTPGTANDLASAVSRGVVVSEIMYHPSSELVTEEYVEIYNGEAAAVNLAGWKLAGGVDFVFPAVTLNPGGHLAVAANLAAFAAKYPTVANVVGGWTGQLSNRGESIQLVDATGRGVDSVGYFDEGDWAAREVGPLDHGHTGWIWSNAHDGGGSSLELVSFGISNDLGQNWAASTTINGTPGASNSVRDADNNVAPVVIDIAHTPAIPRSTDPVTITARLLDELSTGLSATLYWRVDGAASFTAVPMADNGVGPDAVAGDQRFSAQLPAMANGTIVEFYVQSVDSIGNTRTYPSPSAPSGLQRTNLLYQVDDSYNPASPPAPGAMPEYRLIMTEASRAELAAINASSTDRYSHARMNGTFISVTSAGVDVRYRVGVRNRGAGSSSKLPQSFHVDIPRDDTWQGLEAFNLNTQYTQNQLAGLKLFAATGGVAEDAQAVKVRINGVDRSNAGSPSYGVYVQLESSDKVMVENHFPEDDGGNLYKAIRDDQERAWADFRDLGTDPAAYMPYYEKQTNTSENDYTDLLELIQLLNHEPDATFYAKLNQIVDVDQWLNYFATVAILSSEETSIGTGVGDDYLLYRGVKDPRFQLIPHDFDTILGLGDTAGSPTSSIYRAAALPMVSRILNHPDVLPRYHAALHDLLTTSLAKENFDAILDANLTGFATPANIASMKSFMDARRTYILGLVDGPLTVNASLVNAGGLPRATQNNVALTGAAPLAGVRSVTAGGMLAQYDELTGQWHVGQSTGGVTTLITTGDVWNYLDAGGAPSTTPGNDWRVNDPGWAKSGPSKFGYGDTQQTVIQYVDTDPVASGTQKNITTYFRKTFNIADASAVTALNLRLMRDDGAVVYLNGVEVVRSNMPTGTITSTTLAASTISNADETTFYDYAINPANLVTGQNVIAVEVHQVNNSSSDLGFDLQLSATVGNPTSTGGVPLVRGINHINVVAYDGANGTGAVLDSTYLDVWYDAAPVTNVGGSITTNTVWSAANGPYVVTSDLFVEGTGVLTIQPGTTVLFNAGTGLTVRNGGRLVAEGTDAARIHFANNPATGATNWDGLTVTNTAADNRLIYVDVKAGDGSGNALLVDHATLLVDHVNWSGVNAQILNLTHPNIIVRNSHIPSITGAETIHLFGLNQGEQFLFENNVVGFNGSHDDVMDLGHDTLSPATIVIRGNTFEGGWDDGIDTDGFTVLIENNSFRNFHLNTTRPTTSNAVSTGHMTIGTTVLSSNLTLRGNKFYDVDHALLLKDLSFATLEHNTIVGATLSGIHFEEPGGSDVIGPGRGADISSTLFWNNVLTLEGNTAATQLTLNNSLTPANLIALGTGNVTGNPLLVDPAGGDFSVQRFSPALGAGAGGSDVGAWQAPRWTPASSANLQVTEIHYNPLDGVKLAGEIGGTSDFFEFIELHNSSSSTIDLTDVAFDSGVDFKFPWLASLGAGETAVLAKNLDLFRSRYGAAARVLGEYVGQLSNGGEELRLRAADGGIIADINYDDVAPWATGADGAGPSLEFIAGFGSPAAAANWHASFVTGGTPGSLYAAPNSDFDNDGQISGRDFLAWQRGYGKLAPTATHADGDADADGDVDAIDLSAWKTQFGTVVPAAVTASPLIVAAAPVDSAPLVVAPIDAKLLTSQTTPSPSTETPASTADGCEAPVAPSVRPAAAAQSTASAVASRVDVALARRSPRDAPAESPWLHRIRRVLGRG